MAIPPAVAERKVVMVPMAVAPMIADVLRTFEAVAIAPATRPIAVVLAVPAVPCPCVLSPVFVFTFHVGVAEFRAPRGAGIQIVIPVRPLAVPPAFVEPRSHVRIARSPAASTVGFTCHVRFVEPTDMLIRPLRNAVVAATLAISAVAGDSPRFIPAHLQKLADLLIGETPHLLRLPTTIPRGPTIGQAVPIARR